jgi:hypothetical protein
MAVVRRDPELEGKAGWSAEDGPGSESGHDGDLQEAR